MKKQIFALLALTMAFLGCQQSNTVNKNNPAKPSEPQVYVNSKYKFEVKFPHKPKSEVAKVKTSLGDVEQITYADQDGDLIYIVQVSVFPETYANQVNPSEAVKTQVVELAKNMGLEQVKTQENNIPGRPSFYYEGRAENGYAIIQAVAYKHYVYVVAALAENQNAIDQLKQKGISFIKSFKLY